MREIMLHIHFIGLAMGVGTSFAFMFLGMASAKMEASESLKFRLNTFALSRMGHIGLALLILSGLYLMTPYWANLAENPFLIGKLLLVIALGATIGIIGSHAKKAIAGEPETQLKKIEPLGKLSMLIGLLIVALAVYIFK